jgi:hypothetical protein
MPTYTHITAPTNPAASARGGYKDILYFCPVADFATIAAFLPVPVLVVP